jgi:hypothetical protein
MAEENVKDKYIDIITIEFNKINELSLDTEKNFKNNLITNDSKSSFNDYLNEVKEEYKTDRFKTTYIISYDSTLDDANQTNEFKIEYHTFLEQINNLLLFQTQQIITKIKNLSNDKFTTEYTMKISDEDQKSDTLKQLALNLFDKVIIELENCIEINKNRGSTEDLNLGAIKIESCKVADPPPAAVGGRKTKKSAKKPKKKSAKKSAKKVQRKRRTVKRNKAPKSMGSKSKKIVILDANQSLMR